MKFCEAHPMPTLMNRFNILLIISLIGLFDTVAMAQAAQGSRKLIQLYETQFEEAHELAESLNLIFPSASISFKANGRLSAVRMIASSEKLLNEALQMAKTLDIQSRAGRKSKIFPLKHTDAEEVCKTLNWLFDSRIQKIGQENFSIVADKITNSIIVQGSPYIWFEVSHLLEELDAFRQQIMIEATIVEVSEGHAKSMGLNYSKLEGKAGNGETYGVGLISDPLLSLGGGLNVGIVNSGSDEQDLAQGNLTPRALLRLFKDSSYANLLSTPRIMTVDNLVASINVGELVPIQTSNSTSISQVSNIRFEDVGLNLSIKPRILYDELVRLEIDINVKSRSSDSIQGINVPIIGTRNINTTIDTKHGEMIVTGGLLKEDETKAKSQIPLLSKIPFIGRLLRKSDKQKRKTNLFVFLTPYIIDDSTDRTNVTAKVNESLGSSNKQFSRARESYQEALRILRVDSQKPQSSK